jgi:O-antigen ligase
MLGKDATLTGRVQLWHYVKQEILARPIRGWGYSAFWSTGEADRIRAAVGWDPPNAHDGFLDAILGLGFVGLIILIAGLARNFIVSVRVARYETDIYQCWPLFFMIFAVIGNITDTWITGANSCCKPPLQIGSSTLLLTVYMANSYWIVRRAWELEHETVPQIDDEAQESPQFANLPVSS